MKLVVYKHREPPTKLFSIFLTSFQIKVLCWLVFEMIPAAFSSRFLLEVDRDVQEACLDEPELSLWVSSSLGGKDSAGEWWP